MNYAHLHLVLNHVPVVGIPVAIAFLVHGLWTRNTATQRFSLMILVALAAIVLPVYFSGEPAEEVVEHLPGVTESFIKPHEEAAEVSLVLTLVTGAAALAALWFGKNEKKFRTINSGVVAVAGLALISLIYTANLGGKVRHTELRSGTGAAPTSNESTESEKDNDDD
jgi:hypothetical protein